MDTPDFSRAVWRVSSYTGGNGDCVEMTRVDGFNGVRDSKDRRGPVLAFSRPAMRRFLDEVKTDRYDL